MNVPIPHSTYPIDGLLTCPLDKSSPFSADLPAEGESVNLNRAPPAKSPLLP
jgi:hypothetical protein